MTSTNTSAVRGLDVTSGLLGEFGELEVIHLDGVLAFEFGVGELL